MRKSFLFLLLMLYSCIGLSPLSSLTAQSVSADKRPGRVVGLRDHTPHVYAITGARLVKKPGHVIERGSMVVRNGMIEAIGADIPLPEDAWLIDMSGKTIYPGFIESWAPIGFAGNARTESRESDRSQSNDRAISMQDAILRDPQLRAHLGGVLEFIPDEKELKPWRDLGFVVIHAVPSRGIFAGSGLIVSSHLHANQTVVVKSDVSQHIFLNPARVAARTYPTSRMGSMALIRQSLHDARWWNTAREICLQQPRYCLDFAHDPALEAISHHVNSGTPFMTAVEDDQWFLRMADIAREFSLPMIIRASGHEYKQARQTAASGLPLILPLDFPEAPDVSSPEKALEHSLGDLRHWYLAPENPHRLSGEGVVFSLSASRLNFENKPVEAFLDNLRLTVTRGLSPDEALYALTLQPARLLGIDALYGSLEAGKSAGFVVSSGDIFNAETRIEQVWVDGLPHIIIPDKEEDKLPGNWQISLEEAEGPLESLAGFSRLKIEKTSRGLRGELSSEEESVRKINIDRIRLEGERITWQFRADTLVEPGWFSFSAQRSEHLLRGFGQASDGSLFSWTASRKEKEEDKVVETESDHKQDTITKNTAPGISRPDIPARFPSIDYGFKEYPAQPEWVLFKGATIWTQGAQGRLENADMLIHRGLISRIGHGLDAPAGALVVDARGRHISPGLIDPHLHTSISGGVNETGNAIVPETAILDVIDADNVWIYRLLAGGLTTAKLFHGSANPIGGQDAVIKMRWGLPANELVMKEAMPGLKFALGENVKSSPGRYPDTRMGTEQIIRDAFEASLAYEQQQQAWQQGNRRGLPPRVNLQLGTVLEVIRGERLAHVHAYRQDEMLMMMRLAEEYGFRLASFEHTLEGYKIADELREHGAGAVVWTDWSSFKMEAQDGILYNARLLHERGVLTSLHSDNTQLSTRMNWEGGKMIKAGLDDEVVMDMLTMNPARILRIDHLVGSLEPGKQADLVIWNAHPLSGFSTADQTWVDGRLFFDREADLDLRKEVQRERAVIIQYIKDLNAGR